MTNVQCVSAFLGVNSAFWACSRRRGECLNKPAGSGKAKGKGAASAATSDTSSTVADQDLKRAKAHIDHLNNQQIRELGRLRILEVFCIS